MILCKYYCWTIQNCLDIFISILTLYVQVFFFFFSSVAMLVFHHKANKFIPRDIHIEFFFFSTFTYILYILPLNFSFFYKFLSFFCIKTKWYLFGIGRKNTFSTLSLLLFNSFRFSQSYFFSFFYFLLFYSFNSHSLFNIINFLKMFSFVYILVFNRLTIIVTNIF